MKQLAVLLLMAYADIFVLAVGGMWFLVELQASEPMALAALPTLTFTPTRTPTETATPTATDTPSATPTASTTPTTTPTRTATSTRTPRPTSTPRNTSTPRAQLPSCWVYTRSGWNEFKDVSRARCTTLLNAEGSFISGNYIFGVWNDEWLSIDNETGSTITPDMSNVQILIEMASLDVSEFARSVAAYYGESYTPANRVWWFDSQNPPQTICRVVDDPLAFYCTGDNSIYYNRDSFYEIHRDIGDFAVINILAHEWTHLLQYQFGLANTGFDRSEELQADCGAGAYAYYAKNSKDALFSLDSGDIEEAELIASVSGDLPGTEWDDPNAHGTGAERMSAVRDGYAHGFTACFGR